MSWSFPANSLSVIGFGMRRKNIAITVKKMRNHLFPLAIPKTVPMTTKFIKPALVPVRKKAYTIRESGASKVSFLKRRRL